MDQKKTPKKKRLLRIWKRERCSFANSKNLSAHCQCRAVFSWSSHQPFCFAN